MMSVCGFGKSEAVLGNALVRAKPCLVTLW